MSTGFPDYYSGFQQPSTFYISSADKLRVAAASSQAGETVTVYYRIWTKDRQLLQGSFTVSPPNTRAVTTADQTLPEGFLLSVSCVALVALTRGQTFARVFITNPSVGLGHPASVLMADYVTTVAAPGYPNGRVLSPVEGPGAIRSINIAPSFAALEMSATQPTNTRWRPVCFYGNLTCSAAAGNRLPLLEITCLGNRVWLGPSVGIFVGNQNTTVSWGASVPNLIDAGGFASQPLPDGMVLGGPSPLVLNTLTLNMDVNDRWVAGTMILEEWLDNV